MRNLLQSVGDLAAAAVEQRGVGVLVAERGEAGEGRRAQFAVDGEGLRVEADLRQGAGGAQSGLEPLLDLRAAGEIEPAFRIEAICDVEALILGQHLGQPFARDGFAGREREQGNGALAHVPGRLELAKTFVRGEPRRGDDKDDDPAGAGGVAQRLRPLLAAGDRAVIDENVGEAVAAQPSLQPRRRDVVLAGMAYEKNGHAPSAPPRRL